MNFIGVVALLATTPIDIVSKFVFDLIAMPVHLVYVLLRAARDVSRRTYS
jgi:hypothetical protein